MSECVVRIEKPENCQRCELFDLCTGKYKNEVVRFDGQNIDKKDKRCLFVCALPEGHGRLGDLDELAAGCDSPYWCRWLSEIEDAPTIVPAEEPPKEDGERREG